MKTVLTIAVVLGGLNSAGPAHAADAESVMRDYARCVVAGNRDGARALLATAPGSAEYQAGVEQLTADRNGCMQVSGKLRMKGVAFRTAVAEQLYRIDYPAAPTSDAPANTPFQGSGNAQLAQYDVTRCVALRAPLAADRYVRTTSDAQAKVAMGELMPALQSCLPSGAKLGFDRITMRGLLAEGLYHVRRGNPNGAAGKLG